jgi:TRAP-type C4-dicarboxylate transport system permease small subunit
MSLGDMARAITATVVTAGGAFVTALDDNVLTGEEIGAIIAGTLVSFGLVFGFSSARVANVKIITGAFTTFGAAVLTAWADKNITGEDWGYIVGAAIAAAGTIKATTNAPVSIDHDTLAAHAVIAAASPNVPQARHGARG